VTSRVGDGGASPFRFSVIRASLVTGSRWGALQRHHRVPAVLDNASVGRKMRLSGATTAGSEVRVAAEFDGIDGHRATFL
jgi:hypothetical protein